MGRNNDKGSSNKPSGFELFEEQSCHDGLPKARVIGKEETDPGQGQDVPVHGIYLVGQKVNLGHAHRIMRVKGIGQAHPEGIDKQKAGFSKAQSLFRESLPEGGEAAHKVRKLLRGKDKPFCFLRGVEDDPQGDLFVSLSNLENFCFL
jgi:hypothetical protein